MTRSVFIVYRVYRTGHEHPGRHHLHLHQALGEPAPDQAEVPGERSSNSRNLGKEKQQAAVSDIIRGGGQEPDNIMKTLCSYELIKPVI